MWYFILKKTKKILNYIYLFKKKKILFFFIVLFSISFLIFNHLYKSNLQNNFNNKINHGISILFESFKKNFLPLNKQNDINYVLNILELSKKFLDINQTDQALKKMQHALNVIKEKNIKNIIRIRIARIYLQQQQADLAIEYLQDINDEIWMPMKYNLIGDAMMIKNNKLEAIKLWNKSIEFNNFDYIKEIILMKIHNVQIHKTNSY